ncbi:hypothetical protein FT663_04381 [Candidozyma haemuli var. vulneris]|uniref:Suppressor of forked domain-containing protein n=1 Tax=Candidozyma haemuli TaxID=45357 RepID=A0A2V1ATR7_9ASCO|nr:hypothetical protein CXQ85_000172 [[Candida] haemuloni]KAF3987619.1 hypothetical protein FT663_04381 [[Candida] haemuloni var. vulneris]KAF3992613.1 hypothetical protein FT662_00994 [[Candida] haemuloni var. vulneris]PVH21205.1 hypothetical protein CXQ85_000172 [[Candida] haemuloni]
MADVPEIPADLGSLGAESNGFGALPGVNSSKSSKAKDSWKKTSSHPRESNSITEWNEIIRKAEEKWDTFEGPEDQRAKLAASATSIHRQLLSRFPFLTEQWKQFSIFTYKVSGLKDSLAVLELASKKFPQSVSLWVEYLTALISAGDEFSDSHNIDREFARAKGHIGYHFNSDPFWDMYIAHTSKKDDPKDLLELYLYLIHVPLYQYARYHNQFVDINKTFDVSEIIRDESRLSELLKSFDKASVDELSALEKQQLIDDYTNSIFAETQAQVNEKWTFESALVVQDFSPNAATDPKPWLDYLKHELEALKSASDESQKKRQVVSITNLFERSVVPNCFTSAIWLEYGKFAQEFLAFEDAKAVFDRAVFNFVPLNEPEIRIMYKDFLMKNEQFDVCNEYLLDLIKLFSGSTGSNIYTKAPYIHSIQQLLSLWQEHVSPEKLQSILDSLVTGYFDRVDRYKKETPSNTTSGDTKSKYELKPAFITILSKLLNDDGISVVAVAYLKVLETAKEVVKIRTFYNKYYQEPSFSWSVQFWKFFVEFEGYNQVNLVNLRSVLNYINEESALPQRAVDAFAEIYHEIILKNLKLAMLLKGPNGEDLHDTLTNFDLGKSHSLWDTPEAKRMAKNNAHIRDMEEQRSSKNTSNHYSPSSFDRQKEFQKFIKNYSFNPGIFQELPEQNHPEKEFEFVSLVDDDIKLPELPTYKNLDKLNGPIQYPDE